MNQKAEKRAQKAGLIVLLSFSILAILLFLSISYLVRREQGKEEAVAGSSLQNQATQSAPSQESQSNPGWSQGDKDRLAKFLSQKGVVLYYGSSCPHCHDQLEMFGEATKYLTEVDCYSQTEMEKCDREGIEGVPTWKQGERKKVGVQSLDDLASWAGFAK